MDRHIGRIIKIWSVVLCFLGIVASFVLAYTFCRDNVDTTIAFVLGVISTITGTLVLYGFGHHICVSDEILEFMERKEREE